MVNEKLLYEELTYKIRGIVFKVYNDLGPGLNENIYRNSVIIELNKSNIIFEKEKEIPVHYENNKVGKQRVDLLVEGKIIVELKAMKNLHHEAINQILSYLKATNLRLGLLVNFGDKLDIKRYIN